MCRYFSAAKTRRRELLDFSRRLQPLRICLKPVEPCIPCEGQSESRLTFLKEGGECLPRLSTSDRPSERFPFLRHMSVKLCLVAAHEPASRCKRLRCLGGERLSLFERIS